MSVPAPNLDERPSDAADESSPEDPDAEPDEAVSEDPDEPSPGEAVSEEAEVVDDGPSPEDSEAAGPADDALGGLDAVIAERDAYLADLQRVTAEFTNFRRQTVKRNTELVAQAASRLAKELLVVLDACEAAVTQGVEGIEALQTQLLGVLSGEGLTVLGEVDEPFDPELHEAVISEPSDDDSQPSPVVAEILRTGYAWNGRVLRPAMVKVRG